MGRKTAQLVPGIGSNGGGGRVVRRGIALVALGMVLRDPVGAATVVQHMWTWCGQALDSLTTFGSAVSR